MPRHPKNSSGQLEVGGGVTTNEPGVESRRLAGQVLSRVAEDGAYANLVLRAALDSADLSSDDARLVTDLVYGTLRRQRSCDFLINRFLVSDPPPAARVFLRLGAYQIVFRQDIPVYAVVSSTVSAAPKRFRGLCNAILRKLAKAPTEFPTLGDRLSYPDWIINTLIKDLGESTAIDSLESMNEPAAQIQRSDGYSQDPASQQIVELIDPRPGELVADLCASPGGKATGLAATGAVVIASDLSAARVRLLSGNAQRYGQDRVVIHQSDATRPSLREGSVDHVLLDAPCSGLGVLRRRPDARWRIDDQAPQRLASIQREMLRSTASLIRPGGTLTYSVCTLTAAESVEIDQFVERELPHLKPMDLPAGPWKPWGRGAILLPQEVGSDGMCVFRYRYSR